MLDTLTDIRLAINDALKAAGFSISFTKKECHSLIGNGADALIHRALKEFDTPENFERLKKEYMPRYESYQGNHTKPFVGEKPTLEFIHQRGVQLFVCTNKPDALAKEIIHKNYGDDLFGEVRGLNEGEAPKPDPHVVEAFIANHGLDPSKVLFVGDSLPDLLTAQNSKLPLCLCLWGYGFYKPELLQECLYVIKKPKELAKIAL